MSATPAMIEVDRLEKHYGDVHAVDGISFKVAEGEIFGLLGHNGAGKTTTIRMLTGRTLPTAGTARIAGFDVVHQLDRIKPLINLVFEEPNLYERLTGRENLRFFADLYRSRPAGWTNCSTWSSWRRGGRAARSRPTRAA